MTMTGPPLIGHCYTGDRRERGAPDCASAGFSRGRLNSTPLADSMVTTSTSPAAPTRSLCYGPAIRRAQGLPVEFAAWQDLAQVRPMKQRRHLADDLGASGGTLDAPGCPHEHQPPKEPLAPRCDRQKDDLRRAEIRRHLAVILPVPAGRRGAQGSLKPTSLSAGWMRPPGKKCAAQCKHCRNQIIRINGRKSLQVSLSFVAGAGKHPLVQCRTDERTHLLPQRYHGTRPEQQRPTGERGAGIQSSAVLLLACEGVIPRFDVALFADTGWEPRAVYENLARLQQHAEMFGIPVRTVSAGNIRDDALDPAHRFVSMPLHVLNPDGSRGLARRQCTSEYKISPLKKAARELLGYPHPRRVPRGMYVEQAIGISTDEVTRAKDSGVQYLRNVFPLIELGWGSRPLRRLPRPARLRQDREVRLRGLSLPRQCGLALDPRPRTGQLGRCGRVRQSHPRRLPARHRTRPTAARPVLPAPRVPAPQ
jgi:hypothetical protein